MTNQTASWISAGRGPAAVDDDLVVDLAEDLETIGSAEFRELLLDEPSRPPGGRVVIDVGNVVFVTTEGLAMLNTVRQALASTGRTLVLRNPRATFLGLLHVTGLVGVLKIED